MTDNQSSEPAMPYRNVCEVIVPNDLCIGCGLCVGVCPPDVLDMRLNDVGEYIAVEYREGCLPKCDLCLRACPFWDQEENETTLADAEFESLAAMKHREETGYYLETYVGGLANDEERVERTSGGLATWFAGELLKEGIVDKVGAVVDAGPSEPAYEYGFLESQSEVMSSSRSCYYPIEIGECIREIVWGSEEARYALIGLPCFLKGVRLAMRTNRRLRRRVVALLGLVCGQTQSTLLAEYLTAKAGGHPKSMKRISFREKSRSRPANDFAHRPIWNVDGTEHSKQVFWSEGANRPWRHSYFRPNACNFCDDIFAEVADIVFMDAWLEQYTKDSRGTTIVLNRRPDLSSILSNGAEAGQISLASIDIDDVIRSQQGIVRDKREGMQYRLSIAEKQGARVPRKRLEPENAGSWIERLRWWAKFEASQTAPEVWKSSGKRIDEFQRRMLFLDLVIMGVNLILRLGRAIEDGRVLSATRKRIDRLVRFMRPDGI